MPTLWTSFWFVVVFGSIAWYAFLLGYIGIKAGLEILQFMHSRGPSAEKSSR
jgi:hypothetical protein